MMPQINHSVGKDPPLIRLQKDFLGTMSVAGDIMGLWIIARPGRDWLPGIGPGGQ